MVMITGFFKEKRKRILGIIGILYLFLFYAFMYSDILITTSQSINMWDILFEGNIIDFFNVCRASVNNAGYVLTENIPGYDFPIYIIFAIWNFPLWLINKIFHIDIWNNVLAMFWVKTLVLVFVILIVRSLKKICRTLDLNEQRVDIVIFLYLTSAYLFSCVFVISQYDVIYLYLMLEALNYAMNKKYKHFLLLMALAVPIKPFSIFLFMPVLLYYEKNIIKIGVNIIAVFLPWLLCKIIFTTGEYSSYGGNAVVIFKSKIEIANWMIPVFFLLTFFLYAFSYIEQTAEGNKYKMDCLKKAYLAYSIFFVFCKANPYWFILIVPFQCLLIGVNEEDTLLNVIIDTIAPIFIMVCHVSQAVWCFDTKVVRSMYLPLIFGNRYDDTNNVLDIIHRYVPALYDMGDKIVGLFFALYFVCNIIFIYINYCKHSELALNNKALPNYFWTLRILIGIGICSIPLLAYWW